MVDKVAIGNMALANLGQPPVQTFTGPNTASRALNQRYDEARLITLSDAPWNFASQWIEGTRLDIPPKPNWSYVYSYPVNALNVFEILPPPGGTNIPFEVTDRMDLPGKLIHTNDEKPVFVYTVDKSDPNTFDWDFINAFAWQLAHKIAMPVTRSKKAQDDAMSKYEFFRTRASARTRNEGVKDTNRTAEYQAVRG